MPQTQLTIATRGSRLALWQAEHVRRRLLERHGDGLTVSLLALKTAGDRILDAPLSAIGGKGLFVKEIEEALLDGRADLAVHSMKDLPMLLPEGLAIGAVPEREDPTDVLLSVRFPNLASLPRGARVGTSSLRRQAQLLALRPDLNIVSLRGNVDTRLRKLETGAFDAILLARAALKRLALSAPLQQTLGPPDFIPAVGQGALGLEFRADRSDVRALLDFLDHAPTRACVSAERAFLAALEGNCQTPIAAHATVKPSGMLCLEGLVATVDGRKIVRDCTEGPVAETASLGQSLASALLKKGGREILGCL